eukprot:s2356_g25.t1
MPVLGRWEPDAGYEFGLGRYSATSSSSSSVSQCSQEDESSTSDDSDVGTSCSESESDDGEGYGSVDLTYERIMSLQRKIDRKSSTYAKTGTSMTLTGCIVHGYGVFLYLADEGMGTGASWALEVAMRSIDKAWALARQRGTSFPSECLDGET